MTVTDMLCLECRSMLEDTDATVDSVHSLDGGHDMVVGVRCGYPSDSHSLYDVAPCGGYISLAHTDTYGGGPIHGHKESNWNPNAYSVE